MFVLKDGMKKFFFAFLILLIVSFILQFFLCSGQGASGAVLSSATQNQIEADIKATLKRQDAAWNRGDIDAFMEDYIKTDSLRFASGGMARYGWQTTLDGYKARYPDLATMGLLTFTDLEIDVLSKTDALVFGRWELTREKDRPGGLFTLHMKNIDGVWKIKSDHTSSSAP